MPPLDRIVSYRLSINIARKVQGGPMKSLVVKRSIVIAGHKTSVSLEDAFWKGLKAIAAGRAMTLSRLVAAIEGERRHGNLSSAIRLYVLDHYRTQVNGIRRDVVDMPTAPLAMRPELKSSGDGDHRNP
jgi:predicted DNA-binding ribbon-helix-helix protein